MAAHIPLSRNKRVNLIIIACIITLLLLILYSGHQHGLSPSLLDSSAFRGGTPRYAFATFLSSRPDGDIEKDPYVVATRVMAYALLHHSVTRTRKNIPFVVVVPPHVPANIQRLLQQDGATVIQVDNLTPQTWKPAPGQSRWIDQFTKLRLFELTQYDRVLYMDNDMLVTKCLDDIFQEKEVAYLQLTKNATEHIHKDEIAMPPEYSIAGVSDQEGPEGDRPKEIGPGSRLNGGFFVLRPDIGLFKYYKSVLEHGESGRFDAGFMEMGLLNYAHRFMGNMPWVPLEPGKWSSNWPSYRDYERGAATLHDKFWEPGNAGWIDRRLVEMWFRLQGQMEGYWQAKRNPQE